jgi:hypothetical protein
MGDAPVLEEALGLLRSARREHYSCDDCWYSCPKSEDGSCDDAKGDECDCGADAFNATIDEFLSRIGVPL